jgi:hypothetical protein
MDQDRLRRKKLHGPDGSRRKQSVPRSSAPRGKLKGRLLSKTPRTGPEKAPVAAAKRMAKRTEFIVGARKELPRPTARSHSTLHPEIRSLRLRLLVEGDRISVLNAQVVDAPGMLPDHVRGTHFLEVRVGGEVLALTTLIDPGLAVGIPDPRDTKEFRGHKFTKLKSYQTFVRVPLERLDQVMSKGAQGVSSSRKPAELPSLEIAIYRANETLAVESRHVDLSSMARHETLARVATTGRLSLGDVRRAGGREHKPKDGASTR